VKLAEKLAGALQRFDRRVWPPHRAALTLAVRDRLAASKVVVADVGAASGPEERWRCLHGLVQFLTFEPVPRSHSASQPADQTNFPVALSSRKGQGILRLTRDPDAATLYPVNRAAIEAFPVADGLEVLGTEKIDVDTLDNCLAAAPQLRPDFLKVDVEGADLDVLRGAGAALESAVFGVRVEVSFLERHEGAPLFGETDAFLRDRGFQLFHLSREQWIRRNLVHGHTSQPQLVWGDAVYFLRTDRAVERLLARAMEYREALLARYVAILLSHGVHDYALELVDVALSSGLISPAWVQELRRSVLDSVFYRSKAPVASCLRSASALWLFR
jgi:FkbM family methyltransferase